MRAFVVFLRLAASICFLVGGFHLALGLGADALLGAHVPGAASMDPTLDSQNRFYGVSFALNGVLLLLSASDVRRYAIVLLCVLWVLFAGGLARLVSIAVHGWPSPLVLFLLATELAAPPLVTGWLVRVQMGMNASPHPDR